MMPTPSLDYLHEYPVKSVDPMDGGWKISFEGGAVIKVYDGTGGPKDVINGLALLTVTLSEKETSLGFGRTVNGVTEVVTTVKLDPSSYSIIDPRLPDVGEYYPQRQPDVDVAEQVEIIRAESEAWMTERTAEGPSAEWLAANAERERVQDSSMDSETPQKGTEKATEHPRPRINVPPRPRPLS
jgi:hypothetical protein